MKFGELLASLRRERGILQKELAAYLNVTVATISNYEKGVHAPDYETLVKLADFFDVSTDYLLQRTEYKSSIQTLNQKACCQLYGERTGECDSAVGSEQHDGFDRLLRIVVAA